MPLLYRSITAEGLGIDLSDTRPSRKQETRVICNGCVQSREQVNYDDSISSYMEIRQFRTQCKYR